ncbi:MAG: GntR family transcriptional regulator [Actinomycetia bacterium]|nr:GntR family transcriptional regulator [Actinomycetes bacterium]
MSRDDLLDGVVWRVSSGEAVYRVLRDAIIRGELPPNARLREPDLSRRLGVSRTPVREALRLLQGQGYVERAPTGGFSVVGLDAEEVRALYGVRAVLEGLVAREAAQHVSPEDADQLRRLSREMERALDSSTDMLEAGGQMHAYLRTMARNRWAVALLDVIYRHVDRVRILTTAEPKRREQIIAEHRRVIDRVIRGDPDGAEQVMREHILAGMDSAVRAADRYLHSRRPPRETSDPAATVPEGGDPRP